MSQDIITKEQGTLIEKSKTYLDASEQSVKHFKGYAFLAGRTLHALKEITPHGQFETLRNKFLTGRSEPTIKRYMQFSEAVTSKRLTVSFLTDDRLLSDSALTVAEQDKVVDAVNKATGDKGLVEVIRDYQKKKNKKPHVEPTPEERVAAENAQADGLAVNVLCAINVLMMGKDLKPGLESLVRLTPARREELLGAGIRLNDAIRSLGKRPATAKK